MGEGERTNLDDYEFEKIIHRLFKFNEAAFDPMEIVGTNGEFRQFAHINQETKD